MGQEFVCISFEAGYIYADKFLAEIKTNFLEISDFYYLKKIEIFFFLYQLSDQRKQNN